MSIRYRDEAGHFTDIFDAARDPTIVTELTDDEGRTLDNLPFFVEDEEEFLEVFEKPEDFTIAFDLDEDPEESSGKGEA